MFSDQRRRLHAVCKYQNHEDVIDAPPGRAGFFIKEGVPPDQEVELIAGATKRLQRVLDKKPATTVVVIHEIEPDN
jgi:hypothetical protein